MHKMQLCFTHIPNLTFFEIVSSQLEIQITRLQRLDFCRIYVSLLTPNTYNYLN